MPNTRKTAGELSLKALSDSTIYDPLEIGYALTNDVITQLEICGNRHEHIFDEEEYFLCLFIASDPLIQGVRRHKYAAFVHMPMPRPEQSCYLYNKKTQKIKRLWTLPSALVMAQMSEMAYVAPKWRMTKLWCDAFFSGFVQSKNAQGETIFVNKNPSVFYKLIRKQNDIKHLSEREFLDANREKLVQSGCKEIESVPTDSFDFSKISIDKIIDTKTAISDQSVL